jgi:polyisoprenoid-binding protein YceI
MSKTKWALDPTHSEINFKIKHMMISNVTGSFTNFKVSAETDGDNFANSKVSFTTDVNSINTNNEQRDGHLKSGDFFDTATYPEIKFEGTKFEKASDEEYTLHGNLTIKDVTKPVSLKVDFGGIAKDPYGNIKAGFTLDGKINRKDFGLTWNAATETGGLLVGEDLKVQAEIQLVKQA